MTNVLPMATSRDLVKAAAEYYGSSSGSGDNTDRDQLVEKYVNEHILDSRDHIQAFMKMLVAKLKPSRGETSSNHSHVSHRTQTQHQVVQQSMQTIDESEPEYHQTNNSHEDSHNESNDDESNDDESNDDESRNVESRNKSHNESRTKFRKVVKAQEWRDHDNGRGREHPMVSIEEELAPVNKSRFSK